MPGTSLNELWLCRKSCICNICILFVKCTLLGPLYGFCFVFPDGCADYPSICRDKAAITKLDDEIKTLRQIYDDEYLVNKETYLDLRTAHECNTYIMYYINETIHGAIAFQDYFDRQSQVFDTVTIKLFKLFKDNQSSTDYLSSIQGEFGYRLSEIRNIIESTKQSHIVGLVVQYLVEVSLSRFVKGYSMASKIVHKNEFYKSSLAKIWNDPFTRERIKKLSNLKKVKLVPKVLKNMFWYGNKYRFKNFKWALNRLKFFTLKNKFKFLLKGPIKKYNKVKEFFTSKINRKYMIRNFKLGWCGGIMTVLGGIADGIQIYVQKKEWEKVAKQMTEARQEYEKYRKNLKEELNKLTTETVKITKRWPEIIETFIDLSMSFRKLIEDAEKYKELVDVLGLPQFPLKVNSTLFSLDFDAVTEANVASAQAKVIEFIRGVDQNMTRAANEVKARTMLYEKVQEDMANGEPVQLMLKTLKNIYSYQPATIKNYGKNLSEKDIVCTMSLLGRPKLVYDFYQLEPFRPRCDVNSSAFASFDKQASLHRKVSNYEGNSLSTLLDLVHNAYNQSTFAADLQSYGSTITDQQVICSVSKVFPSKLKFDFISLDPFRPHCSSVTTEEFKKMKKQASLQRRDQLLNRKVSNYKGNSLSTLLVLVHDVYSQSTVADLQRYGTTITDQQVICSVSKVFPSKLKFDFISLDPFRPHCSSVTEEDFKKMKEASKAVDNMLIMCTEYHFCPCPALISGRYGISESDIIDHIRALRPKDQKYCGTTGCDCVML